ncbi:MAG: hypothetical protein R3F37_21970 [Candidatus Competibacteraceae bacterium]
MLRIGVVCHPASVDAELRHILISLCQPQGADWRYFFGTPSTARGAKAQDMEHVEDLAIDPRRKRQRTVYTARPLKSDATANNYEDSMPWLSIYRM